MARRSPLSDLLATLEGEEAQLLLSYVLWPDEYPDPRVVDEWLERLAATPPVRRGSAAAAEAVSSP